MKAVLVSPVFPMPRPGVLLGVEKLALNLAKSLPSQGVDVTIVTSFWNGGKPRGNLDGTPIVRVSDSKNVFGKAGVLFDMHYRILARNMLRSAASAFADSDVVYSLMPMANAKEVAKLSPLVSHFHHPTRMYYASERILLRSHLGIERDAYADSACVVVGSEAAAAMLIEEFGIPKQKVSVIPLGVDPAVYFPGRRQRTPGKLGLLTVGRLERRKGIEFLVRALPTIAKAEPGVELTVVGGGPELTRLTRLVQSLRMEQRVHFLTDRYRSEEGLAELYRGADVFVFPSLLEGFGLPVLESMACGTPVVASDIPALREVGGGCCVYAKPRDPSSLAKAILSISGNQRIAEEMRSGSAERAKKYTWARTAVEMRKLFERVRR